LSSIATALDIPLSATHRLLAELGRLGYVRQNHAGTEYSLTIRLAAMGLSYLSSTGMTDVAQPVLEDLAHKAQDLVRLAIVEGDELIFVAKAQGARHGLRYDPDMGASVALSCSAAGHAWLSTMPDDQAMALIARQGLGSVGNHGPAAPTTIQAVMDLVGAARARGYSMIVDMFAPGMSAMGAPVLDLHGRAIGVITVAGPLVRLTQERMQALAPEILHAASSLSHASGGSDFFKN
jgi:IclR family acetate operon transcriptional repressor